MVWHRRQSRFAVILPVDPPQSGFAVGWEPVPHPGPTQVSRQFVENEIDASLPFSEELLSADDLDFLRDRSLRRNLDKGFAGGGARECCDSRFSRRSLGDSG